MTITLHWWLVPVALVIAPFVYAACTTPSGGYLGDLDRFLVGGACWIAAVAFTVGHFL